MAGRPKRRARQAAERGSRRRYERSRDPHGREPSDPADNIRFAIEGIRDYRDRGMNRDDAALAFIANHNRIADDVMDQIGTYPSSEPELAALQRVYRFGHHREQHRPRF
jgi:hypothetical protein